MTSCTRAHQGWFLFATYCVVLVTAQVNSAGEPVRVRVRKGVDDVMGVDAILFDANGNEHFIRLHKERARRSNAAAAFPVFLGNGQKWRRNEPQMEEVEIHQEGDSLIATPLKRRVPETAPLYDEVFGLPLTEGEYTDADLGLPKMAFKKKPIAEALQEDFIATSDAVDRIADHKRQHGSTHVVVDILILVDNSVYRETLAEHENNQQATVEALKKYYRLLVALIDLRYSQIDSSSLAIRTRVAGIYIAEERQGSPWSARHIHRYEGQMVLDPNIALDKLHEWLVENEDELPEYDHAMSFTTYELVTEKGNTAAGMAYIATACQKDGYACSIVREGGGLTSVSTAVHELGHSLGARHDGEGDNQGCPISRNHVMSPGNSGPISVRKNFFTFSACSISQFQKYFRSAKAECLFDSQPGRLIPAYVAAQAYTPEAQCQAMYGDNSGLCQMTIQSEEHICVRIWCVKPDQSGRCVTSSTLAALYGTPCGENKMCVMGECVSTSEVLRPSDIAVGAGRPDVDPHRPEPPRTRPPVAIQCRSDKNVGYCRTLIQQRPDSCRVDNVQRYCCRTCRQVSG